MTTILWIIASIIVVCFLLIYLCYLIPFRRFPAKYSDILSDDSGFQTYAKPIQDGANYYDALDFETVEITSNDGLRLRGRYKKTDDGKKVILLFHGYRSIGRRDFSCAYRYYIEKGFSILVVDQRAHGKSEGKTISFGINERYDCLKWAEYASARSGPGASIVLDGISMGATTVLMATSLPLPASVVGIIADCGYSSPAAIIKKVTRQLHLPVKPVYFLVRLAARVFGHFDLEESSATESLRSCKLPVLFFHGEADDFVPCDMSRENYEACASYKRLLTVPKAAHGFSYLVDQVAVETALEELLEYATAPKT